MMPWLSTGLLPACLAPGAVLLFAPSFRLQAADDRRVSVLSTQASPFRAIFVALSVTLTLRVLLHSVDEAPLDAVWFSKRRWRTPIEPPAGVLLVRAARDQIEVHEQNLENISALAV
jgi:hypothetical protein